MTKFTIIWFIEESWEFLLWVISLECIIWEAWWWCSDLPWLCPGLEFASMNLNLTGDRSQSAPFNPCIEICTAEYNWILTFGISWFRHSRHLFCSRRQTWRSRSCRSPTSGRRPSTSQTLSWLLASASFTGWCCFQSSITATEKAALKRTFHFIL